MSQIKPIKKCLLWFSSIDGSEAEFVDKYAALNIVRDDAHVGEEPKMLALWQQQSARGAGKRRKL